MNSIEKLVNYIIKNDLSGFRYEIKAGPYYIFIKKHFCFKCSHRLKKKLIGRIIKPKDFNKYNIDFFNIRPHGNVYSTRTIFECTNCDKQYEIEDLRFLENDKKRPVKLMKGYDINEKIRIHRYSLFIFVIMIIIAVVLPIVLKHYFLN